MQRSDSSDDIDVTTLRIGFHTDNGIATPALPIQDAILNAISLLKANGFKVDEATPPGIEMASLIYSSLFGADGGETLQMLLDDCRTQEYSPQIADLVPKARAAKLPGCRDGNQSLGQLSKFNARIF